MAVKGGISATLLLRREYTMNEGRPISAVLYFAYSNTTLKVFPVEEYCITTVGNVSRGKSRGYPLSESQFNDNVNVPLATYSEELLQGVTLLAASRPKGVYVPSAEC